MLRMKLKKAKIDDPLLSRLVNFVMDDIQNKKKDIEDERLETEAVSVQTDMIQRQSSTSRESHQINV